MSHPISRKRSCFYRNGLSIVFISMFIFTLCAQAIAGFKEYNEQLNEEHVASVKFIAYLSSGHFISATFENFESEFLQMVLYVVLTVKLRQIGSAESKKLDEPEEVDREPQPKADSPWPVRKGGWILKLYSHSLSLCFLLLFLFTWVMHFYGSFIDYNVGQLNKHKAIVSAMDFFYLPRFWFGNLSKLAKRIFICSINCNSYDIFKAERFT
jgi:ABC-type Mn2+/Zn2+ transport system permease subunit